MNIKWQALIFAALILISLGLTRVGSSGFLSIFSSAEEVKEHISTDTARSATSPFFEGRSVDSASTTSPLGKVLPVRKWSVLDAPINAEAALIQSLDESFPFLHYRTYKTWPIASITKLITAIVALEDIGENKKITVTQEAVKAEGIAGGLVSGEVYTTEDLIKIMLITSSNDAAFAFEDHMGGRTEFIRLMNKKAGEIGMKDTVIHDAAGLSELNISNANDLLKLTKYIIENHPDIFNWTRLPNILVQPTNDQTTKSLLNVNPFTNTEGFLGGKTGTLPEAKQNLLSLFSFNEYRIVVIVLGSDDRVKEVPEFLQWIEEAYEF